MTRVVRAVATAEKPLSALLAELGEPADAVFEGRVFVGPKRATSPGVLVRAGDEVVVHARTEAATGVRLLAAFQGLHALYKPAGLSSEPDRRGNASLALEAARLLAVPAGDVHVATRLDATVSGIVVVAAGPGAAKRVTELQRTHALERRYLAFADGAPSPTVGVWDVPIGTGRQGASIANGKDPRPARTRYAAVATFSGSRGADRTSFLVAEPETGRTHQIRIHAATAGAPLLGDIAHGGPRRVVLATGTVIPVDRVALHATRIRIVTDGSTQWEVHCPLPPDLEDLCRTLGGDPEALQEAAKREDCRRNA